MYFSEPSYEGLKGANEITMHFSAELTLVYVVPSIHLYSGAGYNLAPYLEDMVKKCENL
jgi:hypothetical protein